MKIETRHIGKFGHYPSKLIELTVSSNGASITEDITDLNGLVDGVYWDNKKEKE